MAGRSLMSLFRSVRARARSRAAVALVVGLVAGIVLAGCGVAEQKTGTKIVWHRGTPPVNIAALPAQGSPPVEPRNPTPTRQSPAAPTTGAGPVAAANPTTGQLASRDPAAGPKPGQRLTADQLRKHKPNELGQVPILEYHLLTIHPENKAQFIRPVNDFRRDLEWLYKHDFYVIPLRDLVLDRIKAPAGKHPVVLTFDDSTAGQFRYKIAADGSVSIDPDSGVGILEKFYAKHRNFGRGGFFAALPTHCFDWQGTLAESDQTPYCAQKLKWLLDHGYEVGNHTLHHADLLNVDDGTFKSEVGGAVEALQAMVPAIKADLFVMPYGNYPDKDKHPQQRQWLRNGFEYNGKQIKLLGVLEVGSNPAPSPESLDWDPVWIPRIQACDLLPTISVCLDGWKQNFEAKPELLYTSDGNPNTVTIPNQLPPSLDGTFDPAKAQAAGKEVIRY